METQTLDVRHLRYADSKKLEANLKRIVSSVSIRYSSDEDPNLRRIYFPKEECRANLQEIYSAVTCAGFAILSPGEK